MRRAFRTRVCFYGRFPRIAPDCYALPRPDEGMAPETWCAPRWVLGCGQVFCDGGSVPFVR